MGYSVKETYLTLQGEGAHAGRAAVFCRLAGCNLWNGREEDRDSAACWFCDTDFVGTDGAGGGTFASAEALASHIRAIWDGQAAGGSPYVVFTGGEPTLQLNSQLVDACHTAGLEVGIETNGTRQVPAGVDWVCVSPKPDSELLQTSGSEIKFVFPQPQLRPEMFVDLDFEHFFLQPMDSENQSENIASAAEYCMSHPQWRLSLQTHKLIGLP